MSELSSLGPLIAVAVAVITIFLVLGIFYIVQRQAEKSVRSPEYWNEKPDGRKYPTGWGEGPTVSGPAEGSQDQPRDPPQDPPQDQPRDPPQDGATAQNRSSREEAGNLPEDDGDAPGR